MYRYYSPQNREITRQNGTDRAKDVQMATFAGFNERKDQAKHITTRRIPEAAGHLLAVFDFSEIALAHVVVKRDVKAPEKQQMAVPSGRRNIARLASTGDQYFSYFMILACIPVSIES